MRTLNDILHYDDFCDSHERTRAAECTGKIPAGQPHYRWYGTFRTDPRHSQAPTTEEEQNLRFCVHCVRESNWSLTYDSGKKPILTKVQLTYDDGHCETLEGDAADDWSHSMNSSLVLSAVHGMEAQPLPWTSSRVPLIEPETILLQVCHLISDMITHYVVPAGYRERVDVIYQAAFHFLHPDK